MLETVKAFFRRLRMKTQKPFGQASGEGLRISLGDRNPDIAQALAAAFAESCFTRSFTIRSIKFERHRLVQRKLKIALWLGVPCIGLLQSLVAGDRRVHPDVLLPR